MIQSNPSNVQVSTSVRS